MTNVILVALGGSIGAVLRYLLSIFMIQLFGSSFPFGTLLVNLLGSFLMGVVYALGQLSHVSPEIKALVGIGLLGALTTFSTFSNETLLLLQEGLWHKAILNVLLNVTLCLFMVYVGQQLIFSRV
ncbi:fluoride efflux transporter CrcB [Shewanella sp. SR43-4]|jgi:CrcB protein|uniref:Fluoride-specific ion channel FluC n=1 Tax=Shewanella vesiculosa TaxID=518738 RepID=A0ABV0FME6_9GAMM|nr:MULTISPECIES: fluoride efflux transporter CrcB [Shewanella]NCQ43758.1 fluoride efflux transporter CrcB [Shewanella frigidimarina]MBB1316969.1 fluoride efflux transporter CrcB [Shewanella sp. SR43-4]MBB1321847.1 fluoride efflux transporter CrcB [Shewanella sp. SR43-8]MBB1391617.1 fluoride efflux transporter CrcB [Shewanella sp. SG44-6]MBB1476588.1 fluoride efflux transporter CrcB [Shewanella sp. SG41-3]|tara:strand:+ start:1218 stop:1592 length:375 start_codon:yes stop_codon:yes gene_type:complete